MMRAILLWFSRQKWLQNFFMKFFVSRVVVKRFVSGEELEEAIEVVGNLNQKHLIVTIDHLGEEVKTWEEAEKSALPQSYESDPPARQTIRTGTL